MAQRLDPRLLDYVVAIGGVADEAARQLAHPGRLRQNVIDAPAVVLLRHLRIVAAALPSVGPFLRRRPSLGAMGLLTDADLRQFANDGYVVIRNVVAETLLAAADAEIDGLIAETAPEEGDRGPGQSAWCPPRSRLPRCDDVLR